MKQSVKHIELAFIAGFALYKAACGCGYLSAMGTVADNVGFISTITFMVANNIAGITVCSLLVIAGNRFLPAPRLALGTLTYIVLLLDFLVVPQWGSSLAIGVLYGFSSGFLSVIWLELCIERTGDGVMCITCGYLLSMLLQFFVFIYGFFSVYISIVPLVVSFCLFAWLIYSQKEPYDLSNCAQFAAHTKSSRVFYPALLCYSVCVFVVGVANSAVLDTPIESFMGGVDMQTANLLAAIVCATLVFCSVKSPSPVKVYFVSLPIFFTIFSLIPILGENIKSGAGFMMVLCYQAIAILFAIFSVRLVVDNHLNPRVVMGICIGISNLALLLGLIAGTALNIFSSHEELPLPILVAFSAIYPLGVAFFFATRRRSIQVVDPLAADVQMRTDSQDNGVLVSNESLQGSNGTGSFASSNTEMLDTMNANRVDAQLNTSASDSQSASEERTNELYKDAEVALVTRAQEIAAQYGLTEREAEILRYLARGRSARKIAEELFISENTAWSHIKRIYVKTDMHSKQDILDLFFEKK